ncbi:MAG: DUF2202 domain-containing protein [Ignavibacteria bacterium]|nr:DUF2202 domain-containing protein [Ignavibacteria bacterium]
MKNKIIIIMALFVISSISAALSFLSPEQNTINKVLPASFLSASLTDDEIQSIKYMREEEKLARDVYSVMYTKYSIRPFRNIKVAEQTHMELMKELLAKNNIDDPVVSDETGSFTNSELKDLYTKLIDQGSLSLIDALKSGALIEETDIADLDKQLKVTENKDIKDTYDYLRYGSENHLRAFVRNLKANGVDYTPALLPKDDFDKIIAADNSKNKNNRGNCNCTGKGKGDGRGKGNGRGNGYNCNYPDRNCIYR